MRKKTYCLEKRIVGSEKIKRVSLAPAANRTPVFATTMRGTNHYTTGAES